MENKDRNNKDYYTVDISHIVKSLWKRMWVIALSGIIAAVIGFSVSAFGIAPTYSSSVKLYVNNASISLGNTGFNITASELTAAQSLVRTYGEILESRSTLERIINKAEVDYSWKELAKMIEYAPANDTEIMKVTVTCKDPNKACIIANTIAEVLPERISEIIDGATMEIVDTAIADNEKVAPNITAYTALALIAGLFISVIVLIVLSLLDDTIHDEEYILKNYDYPILGKVPNLLNNGAKAYGYYKKAGQRNEKGGA